jgi:citrate lyase subunit beta/citryl-CoA lyase
MTDFVRRSQLVTPASNDRIVQKALAASCDSLILDLEDAIAPGAKADARQVLRRALQGLQRVPGERELGVRINGLQSPWCLDDVLALDGLPIDTVVIPKVHAPQDVYAIEQLLRQLECRSGSKALTLQLLIESAQGLENAAAIARASSRNRTLIFGAGDFVADTGMAFSAAVLLPVRSRIVTAAAAAGLQAMDHVHPAVNDDAGLLAAARESRALGFAGRWAIHPRQLAPIHEAFRPTAEELDKARRIIAAYEQATQEGEGAIALDGQLVDEAVLKMAKHHLASSEHRAAVHP